MQPRSILVVTLVAAILAPLNDASALKSRRAKKKETPAQTQPTPQQSQGRPQLNTKYLTKGEIGGFGGYMLAGEIPVLRGDLIAVNGATYGGQIDFRVNPMSMIELGYSRTDTQLDFKRFGAPAEKLLDMSINHFSLGGITEIKPLSRIKPYGLFTVGMTWFASESNLYDDEVQFTLAAGLGLKIFLHPRVGLRFQTRLILPLYFSGGGIFCGNGGCGGGLSGGLIMAQGDFQGGAFIAF